MRLGDLRFNLDLHNYATQLNPKQSGVCCAPPHFRPQRRDIGLDAAAASSPTVNTNACAAWMQGHQSLFQRRLNRRLTSCHQKNKHGLYSARAGRRRLPERYFDISAIASQRARLSCSLAFFRAERKSGKEKERCSGTTWVGKVPASLFQAEDSACRRRN